MYCYMSLNKYSDLQIVSNVIIKYTLYVIFLYINVIFSSLLKNIAILDRFFFY